MVDVMLLIKDEMMIQVRLIWVVEVVLNHHVLLGLLDESLFPVVN